MSRRRRPRQQDRRGRHKRASSPETQRWHELYLLPAPPPWCPPALYRELAQLREQLSP